MKYTKQSFSVELIGTRYGYTWDNRPCYQQVSKTWDNKTSLRTFVKRLLEPDFQDGLLTQDSVIKVTLIKFNRRTVRYFEVGLFESISQMVGDKESFG